MNILDIWREVSYYLPPYRLSISIKFNCIYDELWFKHKLLSFNPDANLYISWKLTYKRSFYVEAFRLLRLNYGVPKKLQHHNKFIDPFF